MLASESEAPNDFEDRPFISIVVPTRNRAHRIVDCLKSLLTQNYPADRYEIIVVDDGSADETPLVCFGLQTANQKPRFVYIRQKSSGLNVSRNTGIVTSRGDIVGFVDDDEIAQPGHLSLIADNVAASSDIQGTGGPYRDFGGSSIRTCPSCSLSAKDLPGEGARLSPRLLGGNMAFRRGVFEKIGLFDEELSGRGDESEFLFRARSLPLLYDPNLWVWHRRDGVGLMALCRSAIRQGKSVPRFKEKVGLPMRPRIKHVLRPLAHAAKRRCGRGLIRAMMKVGEFVGYFEQRSKGGVVRVLGENKGRQSVQGTARRQLP